MSQLDHPFILKLNAVAQDKRMVFLYSDMMRCGDLMGILNKFTRLSPDHARFYTAQIVLCLQYLHAKNFLYRDLKPENILIGENGYIKMADFGFVKQVDPHLRTQTFCGTPEYIAPEIILNQPYHKAVDWYALGIMVYELLYGRPPFMTQNDDPMEIFKKVLEEKILFPRNFDKQGKKLVRALTHRDLTKRLGNLRNGSEDVRNHKFFADIDFE